MKILFNIDSSAEPYREDCDSHCKHEMKNIQFTHISFTREFQRRVFFS